MTTIVAKGELPAPLSTGESVLAVSFLLAGVLLAVVIAVFNRR